MINPPVGTYHAAEGGPVDFFERQARIRRTSTRVVRFVLAVVGVVAILGGLVLGILAQLVYLQFAPDNPLELTRFGIFATIVGRALMLVTISAAAAHRTRQLRGGGRSSPGSWAADRSRMTLQSPG
jgi:hypothetical protein